MYRSLPSSVRTSDSVQDDDGYVPMENFRKQESTIGFGGNEIHYKVPSFPRPVSTFKPTLPASMSSLYSSASLLAPPLPLSPPPQLEEGVVRFKPTLLKVKPPTVPTFVTQVSQTKAITTTPSLATTKTTTSIKSSNVCDSCKTFYITKPVCDEVKDALHELSDLISLTSEDIAKSSSALQSSLTTSPLVPGYVQPISKEWEDINRKLNMLVINVKAQNKKIDDIRRVCSEKGDYVTFDELEHIMAKPPNTFNAGKELLLSPPSRHSSLPYSFRTNTGVNDHAKRSLGQKLISCVKFGKNKK